MQLCTVPNKRARLFIKIGNIKFIYSEKATKF